MLINFPYTRTDIFKFLDDLMVEKWNVKLSKDAKRFSSTLLL